MNKRNELLESCLARLTAGDTIESCLADYPEQADWLRPYLTAADQLQTLSPQQPRLAADQALHWRLRQAARQMPTAQRTDVTHLHRRQLHFTEDIMKPFFRSLFKWLPRVVVGGTAVALLIVFITQFAGPLPFLSGPDTELAVESPPANVTTVGETTITLEADLSADPGEVPLYHARQEPIPSTPEEALAWAQDFGLSDPEVYRPLNESDPALYALGSEGQQLFFQNYGGFGEIYYTYPAANVTDGDPLPFTEAADIAVTFLRDHNVLPNAYQVDPELVQPGPVQQVVIRPVVEGGTIGGESGPGAALRIGVNAEGQVIHATLSRLILEPAGTTPVVSAQTAYDDLLNNSNVLGGTTTMQAVDDGMFRSYQPPPPTWADGQAVELIGHLNVLVNTSTSAHRIELMTPDQASYLLTGRVLDELSMQWGPVRIQGTIRAQDGSNLWQVAVETWETVEPVDFGGECLIGELRRDGESARFHSEDGAEYGLPHAPADISAGEQLEVCLMASAAAGQDMNWISIHIPPLAGRLSPGGFVSEQLVTEQVLVEEAVEIPVTRVIIEEAGEQVGGAEAPGVPLPLPEPMSDPDFIEPINPYEIGDEVELTGIVQLYRIVNDEGEERLEATFVNDSEQGEAAYPYAYSLLAAPDLLAEMAEYNQLHIRVYGRIVPPPQNEIFMMPIETATIEVDRFDRPWPEEIMVQFLGHFSVEDVEGQPVLLFTDHADGQQYVTEMPGMPPEVYEHDPALQEEQVLLTGIVHPVNTFGGLPLLERRGLRTGTEVSQATDVSQFSPPEYDTIPVINESEMLRQDGLAGVLYGDVVIERAELMYPYRPQPPIFNGSDEPEPPQLLEPVWAFYGRSADGGEQFIIHVRAVADN